MHAFQRGIDPGLRHVVPDELAVHRHRRVLPRIPHHEIAQALALRVLHGLHLVRIALRQIKELVVLDDVLRFQVGQGVRANQDRHVRVLLAEVRIVHILIEQDLQDPQHKRAVGSRPDRNPVVRLRGRRVVLRRDAHQSAAALHALDHPVRFRHLVLDEVLAPARVQLRKAHVAVVVIRRLHAAPERMRGVLVPVPRVVRPVPAARRLVRPQLADVGVQQRQRAIAVAPVADLADEAQHRHARPVVEALRAAALRGLDLLRRVPLLAQAPRARLARVPLRDLQLPLGQVRGRRVPGHAQHVVLAAAAELVPGLHFRRQLRAAVIHPLLPPLAQHRALQAIRAVHAAMEGVALQAHARVPRKRAAVPVQVLVGLVIVVLLDPHHHAVAHKRAHPTGMRVVRRADVRERRIIPVLIVIDPLPGAVRILAEGVAHLDDRLQGGQGKRLVRDRQRRDRPRARLQKLPSC